MNEENLKQKIKDQKIFIKDLQNQIQLMKNRLDNFESYQREKCCICEKECVSKYTEKDLELFNLKEKLKELIK